MLGYTGAVATRGSDVRAQNGGRFVEVDSLRALAALSIVVFHVTYVFPESRSGLWNFLSQRLAGPPVPGVVVFFLISGFVLYRPFVAARFAGDPMPPLVPYAVRRIARIVPAYWVALAIVTIWLSHPEVASLHGVIRYFGFLQLYGNTKTVQGGISPAWTLCVEVTFYALLPLLALSVRRLGGRLSVVRSELLLCGLMVLTSLVWQVVICTAVPLSTGWTVSLLWTLPGSLDLFAAGMALAVLSVMVQRDQPTTRWIRRLDASPILLWVLGFGVFYLVDKTPPLARHGFAVWWIPSHELKALGAALLLAPLVVPSRRRSLLRRILSWPGLVWLGGISYAIYLWHKPLLDKLGPHLVAHGQVLTTIAIAAVSVAIATVSYYVVERPAQRFARDLIRRRAAGVHAARSPVLPLPDPALSLAESQD